MCGRYTLRISPKEMQAAFEILRLAEEYEFRPRYNIAPTQRMLVVRLGEDGQRELVPMRWGLIPSWARDLKIGASLINARAETVASKPAFRDAFKKRRCLVPADGFYEWQVRGPKEKQPYHIHLKGERPFAFAGLWESWHDPAGGTLETYSIITTDANERMSPLHNRMPIILHSEDYSDWLSQPAKAPGLLQQYPGDELEIVEVAKVVGNVRNDSPECVEPL